MPNSTLLSLPDKGTSLKHEATGSKVFEFDFDIVQTIISRQNDDMVIAGKGTGSVELLGLYNTSAIETPTFKLLDGNSLTTSEFINTYEPNASVTFGGPVLMAFGVDHPPISFTVQEEGIDTPAASATATLRTGYAVDVTKSGWVPGAGTDTYTLEVKQDGGVVGRLVYDKADPSKLTFVLTDTVPHDSTTEATVNAQIWLTDPNGDSVRPAVTALVEAGSLPPLGSDFFFGNPGYPPLQTANCSDDRISGFWSPPENNANAYTYTLTYQLVGRSVEEVTFRLGEKATLQIEGQNFADITFSNFGTFTLIPLVSYDDTAAKVYAPLSGKLNLQITATDKANDNSSSARTSIELTINEANFDEEGAIYSKLSINENLFRDWTENVPLPAGATVELERTTDWTIVTEPAILRTLAYENFDIKPWTNTGGDIWTMEHEEGLLTYYKNDNRLTYTLLKPLDHHSEIDNPFSDDMFHNIPIVVELIGATYKYLPIYVSVEIKDDAPEVQFDAADVEGKDFYGGLPITIDIPMFEIGGDGEASPTDLETPGNPYVLTFTDAYTGISSLPVAVTLGVPTSITIDGTVVGTATLTDGKLVFIPVPVTVDTVFDITLTLTDADGDSATASLPLVSVLTDQQPVIELGNVYEDGLDPRNLNSSILGTETTLEPGWTLDTSKDGWVADAGSGKWTLDDANGQYTYDAATNVLSYTLSSTMAHTPPVDTLAKSVDFHFSHVNSPGASIAKPVTVTVNDDNPDPTLTGPSTAESGKSVELNFAPNYGADGAGTVPDKLDFSIKGGTTGSVNLSPGSATPQSLVGADGNSYGTIAYNSTAGKLVYTPPPDSNFEIGFTTTVIDGDGDIGTSGAPVAMIVTPPPPPPTHKPDGEVAEAHLPGGTGRGAGAVSQIVKVAAGFEVNLDATGWTNPSGSIYEYSTGMDYGKLVYDSASNVLKYELTDVYTHSRDGRDAARNLTEGHVPVKDEFDNTYLANLRVDIFDDMPVLSITRPASAIQSGKGADFTYAIAYGAEGKSPTIADTLEFTVTKPDGTLISGSIQIDPALPSQTLVAAGETVGIVSFNETTHKMTFTPAPDSRYSIGFVLSATDADGDTSTSGTSVVAVTPPPTPGPVKPDGEVAEAHLPEGTGRGAGAVSQIIDLPDDYEVNLSAAGWTNTGGSIYEYSTGMDYGKLVFDSASNELRYELTDVYTHSRYGRDVQRNIIEGKVPVKDEFDNTYLVTLKVDIFDDMPVLSITRPSSAIESGKAADFTYAIAYGAEGKSPTIADTLEFTVTKTDGTSISGSIQINPALSSQALVAAGETVGIVSFNETTHKMTFTPAPDSRYSIGFVLSATDADGDTCTSGAPVAVNVAPPSPPPPFEPEDTLAEAYLPGGTGQGRGAVSQIVDVPDTYEVNLDAPGWTNTGGTIYEYSTGMDYGKLVYDSASDVLKYELTDVYTHSRQGRDASRDINEGQVPVKDEYDNTYLVPLLVDIFDDMPVLSLTRPATAIESGIPADFTYAIAYGADGESTTIADTLEFTVTKPGGAPTSGSIQINPALPSQALVVAGETVGTVSFNETTHKMTFTPAPDSTYSIGFVLAATDADGDRNTSGTAVVAVTPPDPPEDPFVLADKVSEAFLPDGTGIGNGALSQIVEIKTGYEVNLAATGWTNTGGSIYEYSTGMDYGKLVYDSASNVLKYELTDVYAHPSSGRDTLENLIEGKVPVKDAYDNTYLVDLEVDIIDDVPDLSFNGPPAAESGKPANFTYAIAYGADGESTTIADTLEFTVTEPGGSPTSGSIQIDPALPSQTLVAAGETVGVVSFNEATHTMTFTPAPDSTYSIGFVLAATDADGDRSTSGTPFEVEVTPPPPPGPHEPDGELAEAYLPRGTGRGAGALSQIVDIQDGFEVNLDAPGWTNTGGAIYEYSTGMDYGKLVYDSASDVLKYELTDVYTHSRQGRDLTRDINEGQVPVKDAFGNTYLSTLIIDIYDDMPVLSFNGPPAAESGKPADFTYAIAYGADGASPTIADTLEFTVTMPGGSPTSGSIQIDPTLAGQRIVVDGVTVGGVSFNETTHTMTFTPVPDSEYSIGFVLAATDADGDRSTSGEPFVVKVDKPDPPEPSSLVDPVSEAFLSGGTNRGDGALSQIVTIDDEFTVNLAAPGWTNEPGSTIYEYSTGMQYGKLVYDADSSVLKYELTDVHTHSTQGRDTANDLSEGKVPVKDAYNNTYLADLTVDIIDDAPVVTVRSHADGFAGDTLNGAFTLAFGADEQAAAAPYTLTFTDESDETASYTPVLGTAFEVEIDGTVYGQFTLQANGAFTFTTASNNMSGKLAVKLTIEDGDGDTGAAPADATITFIPKMTELEFKDAFDEAELPNGTKGTGSDVIQSIALEDGWSPNLTGWTEDPANSGVYTLNHPDTDIPGYFTYDNAKPGEIAFTLKASVTHDSSPPSTGAGLNIPFTTELDFVHRFGSTTKTTIDLSVQDDAPVLGAGTSTRLTESEDFTSVSSFALMLGADDVEGTSADTFTLNMTITVSNPDFQLADLVNQAIEIPRDGTPTNVRTHLGILKLEYDANTDTVVYEYVANRGLEGDKETIAYSITDTDGDAVTQNFTITLDDPVKEAYLHVTESALPFGSGVHDPDRSALARASLRDVAFGEETTGLEWDVDAIQKTYNDFILQADGNLDGKYSPDITWVTDGYSLVGWAEGAAVIRITAIFADAPAGGKQYFTGDITTEIMRPFNHNQAIGDSDDTALSFDLTFVQLKVADDGTVLERVPSVVKVTIDDDVPANKAEQPIYVEEIPERFEDVFVMLDCSASMTTMGATPNGELRRDVAVKALVDLVKAYEENGITATFTISGFADTAGTNPELVKVTSGEFLALWELLGGNVDATRQEAIETLWATVRQDYTVGITRGSGTKYDLGLNQLKQELDKALNDIDRADINKTVFFITDGSSTSPGDPVEWYDYLRQHPDDFTVYAIGTGDVKNAVDKNRLVEIAGGHDDRVVIADITLLSETLRGFIDPMTGSLLDFLGSADITTIQELWIAAAGMTSVEDVQRYGERYTITPDKSPQVIELKSGDATSDVVEIAVYHDGSYKVLSGSVSADFNFSIVMSLQDADKDIKTTGVIDLIVKDARPTAFDNTAVFDQNDTDSYNLFADQEGWAFSNVNSSFVLATSVNVTFPDNTAIGEHCLEIKGPGKISEMPGQTEYFDHMGHKLYITHVAEKVLGYDISELYALPIGEQRHAYSLASHEITGVSGTISFAWAATGGAGDVSFWLLVDSKGTIVDSGQLGRIVTGANNNGTLSIPLPMNDGSETYTIVFGTFEAAGAGNTTLNTPSTLYINAVVVEEDSYDYRGNIITDPSPSGEVDLMYDMAALYSISYTNAAGNTDTKYFNADTTQHKIVTESGTLIINQNGDYIFTVADDAEAQSTTALAQFKYTIADRDYTPDPANPVPAPDDPNTSSGDLIVQWHQPVAIEKVARPVSSSEFKGNMIEDPNLSGETDQCYTTTYLASVTVDGVAKGFTSADATQTFTTDNGTLTVKGDGSYTFTLSGSAKLEDVDFKVSYTLKDGVDDQGSLLIKVIEPHAYDNVGTITEKYLSTALVDNFSNIDGWESVGSANDIAKLDAFPQGSSASAPSMLRPQDLPPALQGADDSNYLKISGNNTLSSATLTDMFALNENNTLAARIAQFNLEGEVIGLDKGELQGSAASHSFTTTGGKLVFDWSFGGMQQVVTTGTGLNSVQHLAEHDAAFYLLHDNAGNLISSGTLAQLLTSGENRNTAKKYGVAEIDVPISHTAVEYTLYLGQLQVRPDTLPPGQGPDDVKSTATQLVIGTVGMMEGKCHFAGNLLTDASPDGLTDFVVPGTVVSSISYLGETKVLAPNPDYNGETVATFTTDTGGTLLVKADGSYFYSDVAGSNGTFVAEDFTYTITTPDDETDSASLFIRSEGYTIEGSAGNDVIDLMETAPLNAPYLVLSGGGNDTITAGTNDAVIFAGEGNDSIISGGGSDVLTGGGGADIFAWSKGKLGGTDVITDFSTTQQDKLSFQDLVAEGEDLNTFFGDHIRNIRLDTNDAKLLLTIQDGNARNNVELNFSSSDSGFTQMVSDYNAAGTGQEQTQILVDFLILHTLTS